MSNMEHCTSQDIKPTTWEIFAQVYSGTVNLHSLTFSFQHQKCETLTDFRRLLEKPPNIHVFGIPSLTLRPCDSSVNQSLLHSCSFSDRSTRLLVDLSRNQFKTIHLPQILALIEETVETQSYLSHQFHGSLLSNVHVLNLSSNELTTFPVLFDTEKSTPIYPYSNLEELYLNHNRIKSIEARIDGISSVMLPKLKCLDIRHNALSSLEDFTVLLDHHPTLERFSLSTNSLTLSHVTHLPYMEHLTTLGLFGNQIDNGQKDPIDTLTEIIDLLQDRCPMLQELYLLGNPLIFSLQQEEYRDKVQSILPSLKYLDGLSLESIQH